MDVKKSFHDKMAYLVKLVNTTDLKSVPSYIGYWFKSNSR